MAQGDTAPRQRFTLSARSVLTASRATQAIYAAIIVAALARICAVIEPAHSEPLLHLAAFAWAAAFFGFAITYGPLLIGSDRRERMKAKAVA